TGRAPTSRQLGGALTWERRRRSRGRRIAPRRRRGKNRQCERCRLRIPNQLSRIRRQRAANSVVNQAIPCLSSWRQLTHLVDVIVCKAAHGANAACVGTEEAAIPKRFNASETARRSFFTLNLATCIGVACCKRLENGNERLNPHKRKRLVRPCV